MKKKHLLLSVLVWGAMVSFAQPLTNGDGILRIQKQGSFLAGGTIVKAEGSYDTHDQTNPQGQTLHGEEPAPIKCCDSYGQLEAKAISASDFEALTRIPIIIYYGDNIPKQPCKDWALDHWRVRMEMARKFVDCINRHGGKAQLVLLPEIGIKGNSHFLFAEKNNVELADMLQKWIEKNLD